MSSNKLPVSRGHEKVAMAIENAGPVHFFMTGIIRDSYRCSQQYLKPMTFQICIFQKLDMLFSYIEKAQYKCTSIIPTDE